MLTRMISFFIHFYTFKHYLLTMGASVSQDSQLHNDHWTTTTSNNGIPTGNDVKKDNSVLHSMDSFATSSKNESGDTATREETRPIKPVSSSPSNNATSSEITMDKKKETPPTSNYKQQQQELPHKYECIIRDAGDQEYFNLTDRHRLLERLHSGVFLNQKKKKYWVEKGSGHNCFMLFPRSLAITWGEDERYWQWSSIKDSSLTSEVGVEVAELMNVCWLEVHGKLDISYLSPGGVKYEIVFVVMLKDPAYGWAVPVNLRLQLPHGTTSAQQQHCKENLQIKPRWQWIELPVGEFQTPPLSSSSPPSSPDDHNKRHANAKEIEFSMFEYEGGKWKRGLIIKGVIVRPKK